MNAKAPGWVASQQAHTRRVHLVALHSRPLHSSHVQQRPQVLHTARLRRGGTAHSSAATAGAPDGASNPGNTGFIQQQVQGLRSLITPFSNREVNNRLLALCIAQALCSVATLIHDTYLPVYLQDVLGLSNTKVNRQSAYLYLSQ